MRTLVKELPVMTFLHSYSLTQVCSVNSEHMVESTAELLQKANTSGMWEEATLMWSTDEHQ